MLEYIEFMEEELTATTARMGVQQKFLLNLIDAEVPVFVDTDDKQDANLDFLWDKVDFLFCQSV